MKLFDLEETGDVLTIDLKPYGDDAGEMSSIIVRVNGEFRDWWPKLGPWHRSEIHGAQIAEKF